MIAAERADAFTHLTERTAVWLGDLLRHEQTNVGVIRSKDSATIEFSDSLTFHEHGLELLRIGAAHSGSDLVAWLRAGGVQFVGDLAVPWEHGNNFSGADADIDGWIAALRRCIALQAQVVVPAHGRLATPVFSTSNSQTKQSAADDHSSQVG